MIIQANPTRMVPGTAMTYAGIPDRKERANLIAWLRITTVAANACTEPLPAKQ
jgi:cytochrome c